MWYSHYGRVLAVCAASVLMAGVAGCDNALEPETRNGDRTVFSIDPELQPAVMDGRLAFRDTDQAEGYLKAISEASTEEMANAESVHAGFQSLRAYLDAAEWSEETARSGTDSEGPTGNEAVALEKDGVVRSDFPVSDVILSALNHRGEIQFGKTVFKVTRDHVYEVSLENVALLEQVPTLSSPAPLEADERMTVREVETTEVRESPSASRAFGEGPRLSLSSSMLGGCYVYAPSGNGRMHGKTSITNLWFYAEARVSTSWERKKKHTFLWWSWTYWAEQWQSGTLRHEYSGNLYYGMWGSPLAGPVPVSGSQSGIGTHKITRNVLWMVGFGVRVTGSLNAKHYVSNSEVTGSCGT